MTRRLLLWFLVLATMAAVSGCTGTDVCNLCDAIEERDVEAVRTLLNNGEPVTQAALDMAADPSRVRSRSMASPDAVDREVVDLLLERGDPNAYWMLARSRGRNDTFSSGSQTTVYLAAALMDLWGNAAIVEQLITRGLDVRGTPGGEALREAAIGERLEAARALLAAGAPVNHVGVNVLSRTTPLAEAIQTRNLEMIALLEDAGAVEWVD